MRTFSELTASEKTVIRRQVTDTLIKERAEDVWTGTVPQWLSATEQASYAAIIDKCQRARLSPYFFVCTVYGDSTLKAAFAAEASRRCDSLKFLDANEPAPMPPVTGEAVAGL